MATQFGENDPFAIEQQRAQQSIKAAQEQQRYNAPKAPGMVGRVYVGTHPMQHLAELLRVYKGGQKEKEATSEYEAIEGKRNKAMTDTTNAYVNALRGAPEKRTEVPAELFVADDAGSGEMTMGTNTQVTPAVAPDPMGANQALLNSPFPQFRQMAMQNIGRLQETQATQQQRLEQEEREKQMPKVARVVETIDPKTGRPVQQQLDVYGNPVGEPISVYVPPRVTSSSTGTAPQKPLPASVLKIQDDVIQKLGISGSINADLKGIEDQITSGKLSFGPVSNLVGAGLNAAGISTEQSRNFASFKSTLERLRNESLRLNAGVQTDGDAQRAWNELFSSINDTELVKQRLQEIQRINARGAELQNTRLNSARREYGFDPYDATPLQNQPSAIAPSTGVPQGRPGPTPQNLPQTRPNINSILDKYK
jgi:hypothetical protein